MAYQGTKVTFTQLQSCTICLSNEKDLAFGCGHMVKSKNPNKFLLLHLHSMIKTSYWNADLQRVRVENSQVPYMSKEDR
jgi:hypothetical protein